MKATISDVFQFPYMVMALICLVGSVATSFLPETIGSKLPETIEVLHIHILNLDIE